MIQIDYRSPKAMYEQVCDGFKKLIVKGVLREGEQLPSVRELAGELALNPNTIQRAYRELENEGFVYSLQGKGSFVSPREEGEDDRRIGVLLDGFSALASELLYLGVSREELTERIKKEENDHDSD